MESPIKVEVKKEEPKKLNLAMFEPKKKVEVVKRERVEPKNLMTNTFVPKPREEKVAVERPEPKKLNLNMFEPKKKEPLPKREPRKVVVKEEGGEKKDDFKNSLAALIGRGKPGAKKPKPAPASGNETVKVKVDNIFDDWGAKGEEGKFDGGFGIQRVRQNTTVSVTNPTAFAMSKP